MTVANPAQRTRRWSCVALTGLLAILPAAAWAGQAGTHDRGPRLRRRHACVSRMGEAYASTYIWNAGELPNRAEYEIEFPVTADYTLSALYAAAQARPVEISLDGKKAHTGFPGVTGSWDTKSAKWEQQCTLHITRGPHTLLLQCQGPMPHICALRLQSSAPFPDGWQLKRPSRGGARRAGIGAAAARASSRSPAGTASTSKPSAGPSKTWSGVSLAATTRRNTGRPWPSSERARTACSSR